MSIKDVLGKLNTQAGKLSELLSAEEIETLKSFDFDGHAKGIRVEAEKKANAMETRLADETKQREEIAAKLADAEGKLTAKETESLTESEKLSKQLEALNAKVEASQKAQAEAELQAASTARAAQVESLRGESGVNFTQGVDHGMMKGLFAQHMASVDVNDPDAVKAAADSFKASNSALIAHPSNGGSGSAPGTPVIPAGDDILQMSDAQAEAYLLGKS